MGERLDVLRLGYRNGRDPRITTHLALVARAMGADGFLLSGDEDKEMFKNLNSVSNRFGGSLQTEHVPGMSHLKKHVRDGGVAVHLTMYGERIDDVAKGIRKNQNILIIVGAEKVPRTIYEKSDFNVSVSNQPHSEISALAVVLDRLYKGKQFDKKFDNHSRRIIPTKKGKRVISK